MNVIKFFIHKLLLRKLTEKDTFPATPYIAYRNFYIDDKQTTTQILEATFFFKFLFVHLHIHCSPVTLFSRLNIHSYIPV